MKIARSAIASATLSDCSTMIIVKPGVPQLLDDLEDLLHDDGREAERELVDDEHVGFVHERHRQREHLLLAAGELLRRRVEAVAEDGEQLDGLVDAAFLLATAVQEGGGPQVLVAR